MDNRTFLTSKPKFRAKKTTIQSRGIRNNYPFSPTWKKTGYNTTFLASSAILTQNRSEFAPRESHHGPGNKKWGEQDSNLRRQSQQIYSLSRLTASVPPRFFLVIPTKDPNRPGHNRPISQGHKVRYRKGQPKQPRLSQICQASSNATHL